MTEERLRSSIQDLQAALHGNEQLDQETRALCAQLAEELQRLASEGATPATVETAVDSLRDLLLRFETEHPQLTGILGRIADSLANLGI